MEVVWTDTALADVEAIYGYISRFNPHAAAEVALALREAAESGVAGGSCWSSGPMRSDTGSPATAR